MKETVLTFGKKYGIVIATVVVGVTAGYFGAKYVHNQGYIEIDTSCELPE